MGALSQCLAEQNTPEAILALGTMLNLAYVNGGRYDNFSKPFEDICLRVPIGTLLNMWSQKIPKFSYHRMLGSIIKKAINKKCHDQPECLLDILDIINTDVYSVSFVNYMMSVTIGNVDFSNIDFSKVNLSKAKPILLKSASNTSADIRQIALELMGKIKCPEFKSGLINALQVKCQDFTTESTAVSQATETEVSTAATKSLVHYADDAAINALADIVTDRNSPIIKVALVTVHK